MKEKMMAMNNWLIKTTAKQRVTMVICTVVMVGGAILGIYQLTLTDKTSPNQTGELDSSVVVQAIEETQTVADKLASTPAEKIVSTPAPAADTTSQVVNNTATVETPPQDTYIADDGAHYDSEPVYSEPSYSEPAYVEPTYTEPAAASSGGGDLLSGGSAASLTDDWADYGTGISN